MARILLIEDDLITRRLLEMMLVRRGHEPVICATAEEALEKMEEFFPILMVDIQLPGMSGLEFCRLVRARPDGDRYFILVGTANNRSEDLREILDAGADDYIAKPYQPDLLDVRLTIAERQVVHIAARKRMENELKFLASHDPLTEMLNRGQLDPNLRRAIDAVSRGEHAAVLYIDLDNFKVVNDTLGHEAGDRLLLEVSSRLKRQTRSSDLLVRFGGDEFVLILRGAAEEVAAAVAERIRSELDALTFTEKGRTFRVGVSIGLATITPAHTPGQVIAEADAACYAAKAKGRNRIEFHSKGTEEISQLIADHDWSSRIRDGMLDDSIRLWLQPVQSMAGKVVFYETLVRYYDESMGGIILPSAFLPAVERSGQSLRFDRYVLLEAVRLLAANPDLVFSVNLFGSTLSDIDLPAFIAGICSQQKVSCERLILEITESEIVANMRNASNHIRDLQALGCRVAMDDFGTGHCGLSYLRNLQVDMVKVAGVFVENLLTDHFHQTVIQAIVSVSDFLNCETVAEFVATEEEKDILASLGVDYFQGELSGLAGPSDKIIAGHVAS